MDRRLATTTAAMAAGSAMTVKVEGREPIALFRTDDGEFHATSDSCTHEQWSLGEDSDLEGCEVTCPLHMARYDVRTGEALSFPATTGLTSYPVEVDPDGRVYVIA